MQNRGKLDDTLAAMFSNPKYANNYLFYAHMISQCSIIIDNNLNAPAAVCFDVDHYKMFINSNMFDTYSLNNRLGVLKHEMLHILNGHLTVRMNDNIKKNMLEWNYGTDCAINQSIDKDHLINFAITPESLGKHLNKNVPENQSAEFYYNLIDEEQKSNGQNGNSQDSDSGQDDQSNSGKFKDFKLVDNHEKWQESTGDKDLQKDLTKKMIEQSQEQTIKSRGNLPNELNKWLELHTQKSEINWEKVLTNITGNKRTSSRSTIMRRDRRAPKRDDLRGKLKKRTFNLLVVADVSGSMSDSALLRTINEVKHVCDVTMSDSDLIQIDTKAYKPEKISKKTKIFKRKASGGTVLYPAIDMAKEHKIDYQAVVVLTDGGISNEDVQKFKDLKKKVIWLIEPNGHILDSMNSGLMKAFKLKKEKKNGK